MEEAEALDESWLVGRGGERGETPNSGDVVYRDEDGRKSYSLMLDRNVDNAPLIVTQTPD